MGREIRADYEQILMFPPSVEDWVTQDHPARFIRDFVDALDLEEMGFVVHGAEVGRPGYAADLLLKVWLYGYLNRIRASRGLERGCKENMGLIWLTGLNAPDHSSIWRFWRDNKKRIREVFKKTIQVAVRSDIIGLALHAIDGTKIPARSSRDGVKDRKKLNKLLERLDEHIDAAMEEVESAEKGEQGEYRLSEAMTDKDKRKEAIVKALDELDNSKRKVIHPGEPDARFMKTRRCIDLSYNGQVVADQKSGMIVAQDVVMDEVDSGQLVPMLEHVKETLGAVAQENVADSGYYSTSQIGLAEKRQYEVLTNPPPSETTPDRSPEVNSYHHSRFVYDEERNCCICPDGHVLTYLQRKLKGANQNEFIRFRCRDYKDCPHRWECSTSKHGRMIEISVHHREVERQRRKRQDPEKKRLLRQRKVIAEPVFAWIKQHLGFRRWTVRGINNVRAQWDVVCTVLNLKKLYTHWLDGGLNLRAL
jgi:transposase